MGENMPKTHLRRYTVVSSGEAVPTIIGRWYDADEVDALMMRNAEARSRRPNGLALARMVMGWWEAGSVPAITTEPAFVTAARALIADAEGT